MPLFTAKSLENGHTFREGGTGSVADLFPHKTYKGYHCPLEREQVILLLQGGKNTLEAEKKTEKWDIQHSFTLMYREGENLAVLESLSLLFHCSLSGSSKRLFHSSLNNCTSVKHLYVTGCYFSTCLVYTDSNKGSCEPMTR